MRGFVLSNWREAVVVKGGGAGGFRHGAVDRSGGGYIADAPAQLAVQVERGKDSARLGEVRSGRVEGNFARLQCGRNGIVRQAQEQSALFLRELLARRFRGCNG